MSHPDRRGTFANTTVWTCALAAIAGLTVWKFEIWPVAFEPTATGTLDDSEVRSERFAAAPIRIDGPGVAPTTLDPIEPADGRPERLPPPADLAELNLDTSFPSTPDRQPPSWPTEPGPLPQAADSKPLPATSKAPLTGSAFAETGLFPEATAPPAAPPPQTEPPSLETPPASNLQPAGGEGPQGSVVPSAALPPGGAASPESVIQVAATTPASSPAAGVPSIVLADPRLAAVDADIAANKFLAAHKTLSKLYWDEPALRPAMQSRIDTTARSIYFDPQPHYMDPYEVKPGDQLRVFAREYNVPWEYLARLNRIEDASRIKDGQRIKVIKGPFSAVVDLSDYTLTVHAHGYYVRRYPVGTGKEGSTPMGTFRVLLKEPNPKYWGPDGVVMERDDPQNPLGERWIGLDDGAGHPTSYGLHGTIDPGSIGKSESRGCVRLRNEDVAEVYDLLGVGSEVVIQR